MIKKTGFQTPKNPQPYEWSDEWKRKYGNKEKKTQPN